MSSIPITLVPIPVGVGIEYTTIDELIEIICSYIGASVSATVSFYAQGPVTPGAFVTSQFYNTSQNVWYGWNAGTASYLPQTQFQNGDTKTTFVAGDQPNLGWIVCDGRAISAVPGISALQTAVLQNLFGANGNLPNIAPLQSLQNLPVTGSFSGITNPAVAPVAGTFSGLTFPNNPVQPADVQPIATNAETLDASTIALQQAVAAVITQSEAVLDSLLAGSSIGLITKVFVGLG
jgi:hypothetical protein